MSVNIKPYFKQYVLGALGRECDTYRHAMEEREEIHLLREVVEIEDPESRSIAMKILDRAKEISTSARESRGAIATIKKDAEAVEKDWPKEQANEQTN